MSLSGIQFNPEFRPAAFNAVTQCLRVQQYEKVTLITDHACQEIAASLGRRTRSPVHPV